MLETKDFRPSWFRISALLFLRIELSRKVITWLSLAWQGGEDPPHSYLSGPGRDELPPRKVRKSDFRELQKKQPPPPDDTEAL